MSAVVIAIGWLTLGSAIVVVFMACASLVSGRRPGE